MKKLTSAPATVDEYILSFPGNVQTHLKKIRTTILKAAPEAEELISYKMPAYKLNGILVYFAAYENHIGLYATPSANVAFAKEISVYKTGKGSIQFPLNEALPLRLISQIVKFKVEENMRKLKKK